MNEAAEREWEHYMEGDSQGGREREKEGKWEVIALNCFWRQYCCRNKMSGAEGMSSWICFSFWGVDSMRYSERQNTVECLQLWSRKGQKNVDNFCRFKTDILLKSSAERSFITQYILESLQLLCCEFRHLSYHQKQTFRHKPLIPVCPGKTPNREISQWVNPGLVSDWDATALPLITSLIKHTN